MRQVACIVAAGAMVVTVAGLARAQDAKSLAECADAVGAYLTHNPGKEPSRSLVTLTSDGIVLFADSGEGGRPAKFAPFTGGQGAWRCVARDAGGLHVSIIILDFTLATADWPKQRIGRLDIEATVDSAKGTMTGTMKLLTAPLDDDPYTAAELVSDAAGSFNAIRITAP